MTKLEANEELQIMLYRPIKKTPKTSREKKSNYKPEKQTSGTLHSFLGMEGSNNGNHNVPISAFPDMYHFSTTS